jgi:putative colanic acid biosynthesis glycosyltransferase
MSALKKHFPVFTLITITLNNYSGLQKTYKSIEKQQFEDFEWIVIDGGSTDETVDFLRAQRSATRSATNPFRFISEEDEGIYDAMNKGIKEARGRYLLFLNAGDELAADDVLKEIFPFTEKKPQLIYGDALEPENGKDAHSYKKARRYKDLIWGMITHHQAILYDRHVIRDKKLHYSLKFEIASDYDFTARFLQKAKRIIYFPKPICVFEQGGLSQQNAFKGRREQYIIRENLEMVSQPNNLFILTVQTLSWHLKKLSPTLYYALKGLVFTVTDKRRKKKKIRAD